MHTPNLATVFLAATAIVLTAAGATAELATDTIASDDGELTICPVNHATFVMTGAGKVIYVDPVGGAETFGEFEPPDLILITHIHGDHTSAETMQTISTDETTVVAPSTVAEKLGEGVPGQLHVLANGESIRLGRDQDRSHPRLQSHRGTKRLPPEGAGQRLCRHHWGKTDLYRRRHRRHPRNARAHQHRRRLYLHEPALHDDRRERSRRRSGVRAEDRLPLPLPRQGRNERSRSIQKPRRREPGDRVRSEWY